MQIKLWRHGGHSISRPAVGAVPGKKRATAHGFRHPGRVLNCPAMSMPPADLSYLRERVRELATLVHETWESSCRDPQDADDPRPTGDALLQLIDMLDHLQSDAHVPGISPAELNTLSEYGLQLLSELAGTASRLDHPTLAAEIEHLSFPYALWIARHGGEIRRLESVVNALAHFANQSSSPETMASLYCQCCELIDATSPAAEEGSAGNPRNPWRLLLLNRAIVATRSLNAEFMEPAFNAIVELLPNDAERFFAEGMEQMAVIDYPEHVRAVVRRYYLAHAVPRRLH